MISLADTSLADVVYDEWPGVARVVIVSVVAYIMLIVVLRLSGKRTLAKMNAFDLVVTVAFGSVLATIALSGQVTLAEGATALAILAFAQFVVAWTAARYRPVRAVVKSVPALLLSNGRMLTAALLRERVTTDEIRQAVRAQGLGSLQDVAAVVLETDGSFSVIPTSAMGSADVMVDVRPE